MTCLKFQGCLAGALIGDALGSIFEFSSRGSPADVHSFFKKLQKGVLPKQLYTDDYAMTRTLAASLLANHGLQPTDLAQRFVECYEDEPDRGYGANVGKVFKVLRATSFQNPFLPAREQFAGGGSYGNGAAMRVSPVGLFYSRDSEESEAIKVAKMQSLVTHAHPLGYFGAILMCLAIREALKVPSDTPVNPDEFLDALQLKLNALPLPGESREEGAAAEYREKLLACRKLLKKDFDKDEIVNQLGNSVSAVDSVITAFYCFLACYNYNQAHEFMVEASGNEEGMEKSLRLACMLGGDTDTIANMACALVGAHVGLNSRICFLLDSCEEGNEPLDLGRHIYDLVYPSAS